MSDLIERAEELLTQCGPHDYGLVEFACGCSELDHRPIVSELLGEIKRLRAQLGELNNAINWHTSCLNCASLLDASYAETVRAEKAKAQLERVKPVLDAVEAIVDRHWSETAAVTDCELGNCHCLRSVRAAVDAWKNAAVAAEPTRHTDPGEGPCPRCKAEGATKAVEHG